MAIEKLPVNFKDDVIDMSVNEKRRYNIINNPDGTVSLEDVTVYKRVGDDFGENQVNQTNDAVNKLIDNVEIIEEKTNSVFILRNQAPLFFTRNTCSILDDRIKADSLADVYFTSDTMLTAEKAAITIETYDGRIDLYAGRQPEGEIKASIVVRRIGE